MEDTFADLLKVGGLWWLGWRYGNKLHREPIKISCYCEMDVGSQSFSHEIIYTFNIFCVAIQGSNATAGC